MNNAAKKPVSSWLDFMLMAAGFWMLFSPAFLRFNSAKPENRLVVGAGLVVITLAFSLRHTFRDWAAALRFVRRGQLTVGLPPTRVRPCWAHQTKTARSNERAVP